MEAGKDTKAASKIGELLKRHREGLSLNQREIAHRLRYRSVNFISMLERGGSNIPFAKIPEIVTAYNLPPIFLLIILRECYRESWQVMSAINSALPGAFAATREDREKMIDEAYTASLREYRIE